MNPSRPKSATYSFPCPTDCTVFYIFLQNFKEKTVKFWWEQSTDLVKIQSCLSYTLQLHTAICVTNISIPSNYSSILYCLTSSLEIILAFNKTIIVYYWMMTKEKLSDDFHPVRPQHMLKQLKHWMRMRANLFKETFKTIKDTNLDEIFTNLVAKCCRTK